MVAPHLEAALTPWATHRRRADVLRERYPFAAEPLGLYLALLDVWEQGWDAARRGRPEPGLLVGWAVERVLPAVVAATETAGPEPLIGATHDLVEAGRLDQTLAAWLAGAELPPVDRYLARACLWAPLVALDDDAGAACTGDPSPRGGRRCPRCGGPPQLSFRGPAEDRLDSGRRRLACARCGHSWGYSASSCPSCGEASGARRTVYAERRAGPIVGRDADEPETTRVGSADPPLFPHLRIDACASCARYLIDVDLGRDTLAVPDVDELVAIPLDLYATEQGLSKIIPNLMGF